MSSAICFKTESKIIEVLSLSRCWGYMCSYFSSSYFVSRPRENLQDPPGCVGQNWQQFIDWVHS